MMQKLNIWKEKILTIGVEPHYSDFQIEEIRNSNQGSAASFLFSLIASLLAMFWIRSIYVMIPIMGSFLYLLGLWANYKKKYLWGSSIPYFISVLLFFWMAQAYGKSSGAYLLFIIAEIMAIYNLKYLNTRGMLFQLSLPILFAISCYVTDFSLFPLTEIPESSKKYIEPIMYFSVLLSCATIVLSYAQNTQKHFRELEEAKNALQKKYQELEEMNAALSKTNEELDKFVYSVSHDLRAPITSVLGLIDVCRLDKENIDTYLNLQEKSMHKLDNFIKDILHYSRNSRLEVKPVALNLPEMIKEKFQDQAYSHSADDMLFEVKVNGSSTLYSDEFRLNIILANLISNAIRYRNPAANPSFLRFEVEVEAEGAKITVADNGVGIAPQHLSKIFEMFYRGNEKAIGSGLGLYIVEQTLKKMNGSIEVQSEEGKGTAFIVKIPNLKEWERMEVEAVA